MDTPNTVLVVDDEHVNFHVLEGILGKAGYKVLTASSGPKGFDLAVEHQPDVILLDVMMPDESGFDTCLKLKQNPQTADIPVIFLTCLDDVTNKITGLNLGAVDYVTKPFHANEVLARIKAHLGFKRRQQDIIDAQADRLGQIRTAQRSILVDPDEVPEAKFGVRFVPVVEVGGDFYDVISLGGARTGYFVADVSGHDMGAGFVTSSLKALFRQNAGPDKEPEQTLRDINSVLKVITPPEMYLTATYVVIDRDSGRARLASAGHPPVVRVSGEGASVLGLAGDVIGMYQDVEFGVADLDVAAGERLFLFTDGLLESKSGMLSSVAGNLERLCGAGCETKSRPLGEAVQVMLDSMLNGNVPGDDVVLMGVEV